MFTGIIEDIGKVVSLKKVGTNLKIGIESALAKSLKPGQSVAHNGVCLTVEDVPSPSPLERAGVRQGGAGCYYVTAVKETLSKTNLGLLKKGSIINLERSLKTGDRLDGHFVQGHVDCTAEVKLIKKEKGSRLFEFHISIPNARYSSLIIEKGSICINGVSLTVVNTGKNSFSVAVIPHTFKHTNFKSLKVAAKVNVEFDVLGKYIQKALSQKE